MYVLKHGIKKNPEKRWALPDRIFFGHGACAILAGTFLKHPPLEGFYGERIIPDEGFSGNHIYVTNGLIAFDYHGYCARERLLDTMKEAGLRATPDGVARLRKWISICSIRPNSTGERCSARISICMTPFLARDGSSSEETTRKPR